MTLSRNIGPGFGWIGLRFAVLAAVLAGAVGWAQERTINLPSSKELGEVPGNPQRVNSEPISLAVSPDGRYVVSVNAGYGTAESKYEQSLAVMDTRTGKIEDFPDARTDSRGKQTLYSGIAFSSDGKHLYVSMPSLTEPEGHRSDGPIANTGSCVAVYRFSEGKITPEKLIRIPMQPLAGNRRTELKREGMDGKEGVPYPAAIAVVRGKADGDRLLVADNLSDDVLLIDEAAGRVLKRFDLSESDAVPGTYPIALALAKDGVRAYVALWNASEVVELNLSSGTVGRKLPLLKPGDPVKPGSHPCALQLSPDGKTLYVALANRDAVAAVDISGGRPTSGDETARHGAPDSPATPRFAVKGYFDTKLPGQSYFGAEPDALAISADGKTLYAANVGSDAVAVMDTAKLTKAVVKQGFAAPEGFIPTQWMPISMLMVEQGTGNKEQGTEKLYIATDKGEGTGPNDHPQFVPKGSTDPRVHRSSTYIATLLYGSLAAVDPASVDLKAGTDEVLRANRMKAAQEGIAFAGGHDPIRHVIYIIKENRTYDQIFGDLRQNGHSVGDGDARLAMYGAATTPNEHKLALQFGVLDNFFDSGEVSGDGHVWSNAAIGTDYLEKTWQQDYRNGQRTYDYEGVVAQGYPLLEKIPDVNEPQSGYMWGNADAHGKTHYNFGEYISSTFCNTKGTTARQGPMLNGGPCAHGMIQPGEAIPEDWGGGVNKWPWGIPRIEKNVPTKPELVGHFAPEAPDFNLRVPDQIRANVFLRHFAGWVADRAAGNDMMPNYITMRLPDDHTAGTTVGGPTPKSSVADNDLALGRIVEAVSHSAYWDDTAIFVLEDDAQDGADHVDAHRSLALVISKYAPHGTEGGAFVDSRFYTTVSVVRTMETLLGLPPMNNNDALAPLIGSEFTGPGDQAPYVADTTNRDNGLIYTANGPKAVGAKESAKMDFSHEDRAPVQKLNVILWKDAMGDAPVPAQLLTKQKMSKKDDDD